MAKILLIEDETSLIEVYAEMLSSAGHEVIQASDGETGLDKALHEDWRVLFLDIMLPGMDGVSILRKIVDAGKLEGRDVVILSTLDNPTIVNECMRLGASEHLNKASQTPDKVLQIVEKYITKNSDTPVIVAPEE